MTAGAALPGAAPALRFIERSRVKNWLILWSLVVLAALFGVSKGQSDTDSLAASSAAPAPAPAPAREAARFVGSAACAECHRAQSDAHRGSHHEAALATLSPADLARFDGRTFSSLLGGKTTFSLRDGAPVVSTPMPGGQTATLPVRYVAGVQPLQQYVVETERGKLQSLGVAWDTDKSQWFHVYGKSGVAAADALFFAGAAQNWNHICADCHSTGLERRYDGASDSFDTRWAELSVGCEACHGPGSEHVRSAKAGKPEPLPARLHRSEPWRPSATGSPEPRAQEGKELESCAPCHSRRLPLKEGFVAGDAFLDAFEPDLLRPGRYYADGQVEGEVFEWGSFQQSRMHQAGVRCSDCHEPHSGKPLAQGNALCVRCHEPSRFDTPAHSRHAGANAPRCVDCHMPPATFMQVHERRDHSIRIPRPDHSVAFGVPNACNGCHQDKAATWARDWVAQWAPAALERPHFVDALASDRAGELEAPRRLRELALDASMPSIARATALERLGSYPSARALSTLREALSSPDALIVYGAARGAAQLPPPQRASLLVGALTHRARAVRVAAAKGLAGAAATQLPASARGALERAFVEVEQSFDVSASRPETLVEQSAFELARGKREEAERALQRALRLDPCSAEAQLNLADVSRQRGDEAAAERAIRAALMCNPKNPGAHHALGLWYVRAKQPRPALASLKEAKELLPTDSRFSYVLAVAMADSGDLAGAIQVLEAARQHRPSDASVLQALASYRERAGSTKGAAELRRDLEQLLRD